MRRGRTADAPFSPPDRFPALVLAFSMPKPSEPSLARLCASVFAFHQLDDVIVRRFFLFQLIHLMLGEKTDLHFFVVTKIAIERRLSLPHRNLAKVLLPLPLAPKQANTIVNIQAQIDIAQHGFARGIADGNVFHAHQVDCPLFLPVLETGREPRHRQLRRRWVSVSARPFRRLCACLALEALALNRSTKASIWRRLSSCFFFSLSCRRCCSRRVFSNVS